MGLGRVSCVSCWRLPYSVLKAAWQPHTCDDAAHAAGLSRSVKLPTLRRHGPAGVRFCGVDCSAEALRQTERSLQRLVPDLPQEQVGGYEAACQEREQGRMAQGADGLVAVQATDAALAPVNNFRSQALNSCCMRNPPPTQQVDLLEAEYLAGVEEARRRHPEAMLSILWLGSSGEQPSSALVVEQPVLTGGGSCAQHPVAGQLEGAPCKCAALSVGGSLHQSHGPGPPSALKKPDSPAAVSVLTGSGQLQQRRGR